MAKVSIIIPSRNEPWLAKTVDDIRTKATGDIEVIVILDGPTDYPLPTSWSQFTMIKKPQAEGLKPAINDGARAATGEYLMKCDAHCMFGEGFDEILQDDCENDWVVTARRFTLNPELWKIGARAIDYYYLGCPWTHHGRFLMKHRHWKARARERQDVLIDDQMTIHGSMWFMSLDHFRNRIGDLDTIRYGTFAAEPLEIVMKTWLGGGRVVINKNTWYAHEHLTHRDKDLPISLNAALDKYELAAHDWTENKWKDRVHDFDWLIEKFWRVPNWPSTWRNYYEAGLV